MEGCLALLTPHAVSTCIIKLYTNMHVHRQTNTCTVHMYACIHAHMHAQTHTQHHYILTERSEYSSFVAVKTSRHIRTVAIGLVVHWHFAAWFLMTCEHCKHIIIMS